MPSEWVVVRLKVAEKQRFIADMRAAGYSTRGFGNEVDRAGNLMKSGAHHGFVWNQMLFTMRRTLYHVTQSLGLLAAGVVYVGFKFNAMMEQQQIAFTSMLKNARMAKKEVNYLFQVAAHGPFSFKGIITAARQLLAFGMPLKDVNSTVVKLQDAMAGMGLDESKINRAALALGEINSQGRLMGRQVRMLEILGLINPKYLAKKLNVSDQQLANPGKMFIPAKVAIDAITSYWSFKFGGAASKYQRSWVGLISTAKDEISATAGLMVKPIQDKIRTKLLPDVNRIATQMQVAFADRGFWAGMRALDKGIGHGVNLTGSLKGAQFFFTQLWQIVKLFTVDFVKVIGFFRVGAKALYALGGVLWFLNNSLHILNPLLEVLIALFVVDRAVVTAVAVATRTMAFWDGVAAIMKKRLVWWTGAERASLGLNLLAKRLAVLWSIRMTVAGNLETVMYNRNLKMTKLNTAALLLFQKASKLAAVGTGILTLALGTERMAALTAWAATLGPITLILVGLAAIAGAIYLIIKYWRELKHAMGGGLGGDIAGGIGGGKKYSGGGILGNWLSNKFGAPGWLTGAHKVTGMATGGTVASSGLSWVGENGPELRWMPKNASVIPLSRNLSSMGDALGGAMNQLLRIEIPLYINKHKIAQAVAEGTLSQLARA